MLVHPCWCEESCFVKLGIFQNFLQFKLGFVYTNLLSLSPAPTLSVAPRPPTVAAGQHEEGCT